MPEDTCSVDGCNRPIRVKIRRLCAMHYHRWQRWGNTADRPLLERNVCIVDGCGLYVVGQGWCSKHYTRWTRYGDPLARMAGEVVDGKRICPKCKLDLPIDQYGTTARVVYCKPCTRAVAMAWRKANPEYAEPPKDPAKVREWARLWREANPDAVRAQTALRRALRYHPGAELFSPRAVFDRDGWICGICTEPIDIAVHYPAAMSASLDHIIPLTRGGEHTRANTQAAHLLCNMRKYNTLVT